MVCTKKEVRKFWSIGTDAWKLIQLVFKLMSKVLVKVSTYTFSIKNGWESTYFSRTSQLLFLPMFTQIHMYIPTTASTNGPKSK